MGNRRGGEDRLRVIRRGVGLALALTAVWGISLTADLSRVWRTAEAWAADSETVVRLVAAELGQPQEDTALAGLDGWGRLLVSQSALLSAGKEAVAEKQAAGEEAEAVPAVPEDKEENDQEPQALESPAETDETKEITGAGGSGGQYLSQEGVYLLDRTNKSLTPSVFAGGTVRVQLGAGPQILILHTHGSEAYSQSDGNTYSESDAYRTTDCAHNVVRVGEVMAEVFRSQGFQVVHDTSLYDYPAYNGAYERSKTAVARWLEKYPTIQFILDVHRDALVGEDGTVYKLVSEENGTKTAQVMLVVGTDGGGADHPGWQDNLALAIRIQKELISDYTSLARPIVLRNSSYNQQLAPGYLLVEVGGHGNTLAEAEAGAERFAESAGQVLNTLWVK